MFDATDYDDSYEALMSGEIVPARGRESLPERMWHWNAFDDDDLDAVAPFSESDRDSLSRNAPTPEAEEALRNRILAAQKLKYGEHE